MNEKDLKNVILCSILVSLAIAGTVQFLVLLPIFLLAPWFIFTIMQRKLTKANLAPPIRNTALIAALFTLLSSYWLYPTIAVSFSSTPPAPDYVLTDLMLNIFSSQTSILNAFRLLGVWWPYVDVTSGLPWIGVTFTIPAMLLLSMLWASRYELRFYVTSLFAIALFTIFFFKGSQPPIPEFYSNLYNIPVVGWMFRVPDTNGIFLPFLFMMIIALGSYSFLRLNTNKIMKFVKTFPLILLIASVAATSWPMFTGDFNGIYKDDKPYVEQTSVFEPKDDILKVSQPNVIILGNSGMFDSLRIQYDSSISISYADKDLGSINDLQYYPAIIMTDERNDIGIHLLDSKITIAKPFSATLKHDPGRVWSRASTSDPLHGTFHNYLSRFGIENNDFDYGMGLVLTWGKDRLNIPLEVPTDNDYKLFVRYLQSPGGGVIRTNLLNHDISVDTRGETSKFVWKELGTFTLARGTYTIGLENISGINAVNVFALVDVNSFQNLPTKIERFTDNFRIIYVLEESNFYTLGRPLRLASLFDEIGGTFKATFTSTLAVPAEVSQLSFQVLAKSSSEDSSYKITDFQLIPITDAEIFLANFEDEEDQQLFNTDENYIDLSIERDSPLSGDGSMRADIIRSSKETWNVISTNMLPASEDIDIKYNMVISSNNTKDLHSKIKYYDIHQRPIGEHYLFDAGTFTNNITRSFTTPIGTRFISFEFWVKTNPDTESMFMVDNIRIEKANPEHMITSKEIFDSFTNDNPFSQVVIKNDRFVQVLLPKSNESSLNVVRTKPIQVTPNSIYEYRITVESQNIASIYSLATYLSSNAKMITKDDSLGNVLALEIDAPATVLVDLVIPKDSVYTVAARIQTCNTCSAISMQLGNTTVHHSRDGSNGFRWFHLTKEMEAGNATLKVYSSDRISIDKVILYSDSGSEETVDDILNLDQPLTKAIDYSKVDDTNYYAYVNSTKPFVLRFEREYDPNWSAYVNGQRYRSVELYPNVNGFYISEVGELEIKIEYDPQKWFTTGLMVTTITVVISVGYLTWKALKKKFK
ncbi:MAG TPA: hypothetical protein VNI77_00400 [Nitrososphaera sp.]|nr:hypothetical protein [Nitrososphaera sp.]